MPALLVVPGAHTCGHASRVFSVHHHQLCHDAGESSCFTVLSVLRARHLAKEQSVECISVMFQRSTAVPDA